MALFKILKGKSENLPGTKVNGYCYVTTDEHKFYVDYIKDDNTLDRFALNAETADSWKTARNLNGMVVNGTSNVVNYGTCSTAAATAAKVVACSNFALITGAEITVKFATTNTASNPTLNVNSTGAKAIYYRGSAISAGYLAANRTYTFRYNGSQYELVGDINTNTTYSNATTSTAGLMSASDKSKLDAITASADSVSFEASATSGNKVGTITINGTATNMYSPTQTSVSGNAGTATKLATPRTISLAGDVTGSGSFDGSANLSITATVVDDSHNHIISNVDGLQTALDEKMNKAVQLSSDNLNNINTPGFYFGAGSNTCTNKPSNVDAFGLEVFKTAAGYITQVLTEGNTNAGCRYMRQYNASSWSSWIPLPNFSATPTSGQIVIADGTAGKIKTSGYTIATSVPSGAKFTDTTYSPGTGLSLSGTTFNHSNSVTAGTAQGDASKTLSFGGTFTIPTVTYDAQGHITGKGTTTMTMPANPNVDTKVTQAAAITTAGEYPVILGYSTATTAVTNTVNKTSTLTYNPSTKILTATTFKGTLSGNASSASKVSNKLTVGEKTYDGSAAVTIAASDLGLASAMLFLGTTTTAITDGATTNPITISGASKTVTAGNVVLYGNKEFVWTGSAWEELGNEGSYKVVQTAVADPSASGTASAFIDSISQDTNGKITVTKKTVAVTNSAPTLSWSSTSTIGTVAGTDLQVKMPANPNTDTKVTQTVTTSNATYPLLLAPSGQTATTTTTSYFDSGVTLNPSTNTIAANISGNAASSTYATNARITLTNPTSATTYYPTWVSGTTSGTNYVLRSNNGVRYITLEGTANSTADDGTTTAGTTGYGTIILGNNVASGTAANKYGSIRMYGTGTSYVEYKPFNNSSSYVRYLVGTSSAGQIGSATQPVYISSVGTVTACTSYANATVGTANKLGTATVGSDIKPIYLKAGVATASSSTVGSETQTIYLKEGEITASLANVGGAAKPIYLNNGVITACSGEIGSGKTPVYMSDGEIVPCSGNVGNGARPVYMSSGTITACGSSVGSSTVPVYMSSGTITQCSTTLGVSITGNAATATKLATARTVSLTGAVTGSGTFDGSSNLSISTALDIGSIELFPGSSAGHGGYIDFHYNSSSADYTSRIIESASGTLNINGTTITASKLTAPQIQSNNTLTLYRSTSINNNYPATLQFTVYQTDNSLTNTSAYIKVYDDHDAASYGCNMVIQSGGNMIIGSGESPSACYSNDFVNSTGEQTYITSDGSIYFYTNCQTYSSKKTTCYINTSGVLYGACWNDYAEYRICKDNFKPGQVVCENNDDTLNISTYRLQPGANIISDTYGFAIGETDEAKCPIAVSGRVLAYTYEPREEFNAGDAVCAGPNGTVSKMTREEIKEYPERIIGTVSAIPNYETWGSGNVPVNGRIWIKVV